MAERKRKKTCFVLMPFAEQYREVYEQVYKPVCEAHGIRCWRVDEVARPGSITRDIVEGIVEADLIIADLTSQNPNVFYELGIAHAIGSTTIMTCQRINEVPFDIAHHRIILYEQTIAGSKQLAERLAAAINELRTALNRTSNPVQHVLADRSAMRARRRIPLFKAVDLGLLAPAVKRLLAEERLTYLDELKTLDLEAIAERPGFGKTSLSQLAYLISTYELYESPEAFQRFIQEHGVRLSAPPNPWYRDRWRAYTQNVDDSRRSI